MAEYGDSAEIAAELALDEMEGARGEPPWFRGVAFTTLVFAVLAAAASLMAGMTAHETLLDRTEEIVDITQAEADRVSIVLLQTKHQLQIALGETPDPAEVAAIEAWLEEADRLEAEAAAAEEATIEAGSVHLVAAVSATIYAVAIAVTGLAAIVRRKWLWYVGGALGIVASVFLIVAVVRFV